jgi:cytochrome c oxidase assembly protein subunit 23
VDKPRAMMSQFQTECQDLANLSYKCLEKNNYDKGKCQAEFDNYRDCKGNEHRRKIEERRRQTAM